MKIVYLLTDYVHSGGIERVISIKTSYLLNKGFDVYIVTYLNADQKPFFHFNPAIKIIRLDIPSVDKKYESLFLERLNTVLSDIKPDIVISTGLREMNCITKLKDGSKKVLEMHFSKYRRKFAWAKWENNPIGRLFLKMYFRKRYKEVKDFDKIVLLTDEDRTSWNLHSLSNLAVIPNSLSFPATQKAALVNKRIIAIGRFVYAKGFDILIDIWKEIAPAYPDWELAIFGEDRINQKIQKKLEHFSNKKSIKIYPPVPDIQKEFLESSIMVMTSRYEGFGMVLLESMACGLPAVAFACKCGPRDLIDDSVSGFLIEPGNKKEFAQRLRQLMDDRQLRQSMGEAAFEKSRHYTNEKIIHQWEKLFQELFPDKKVPVNDPQTPKGSKRDNPKTI